LNDFLKSVCTGIYPQFVSILRKRDERRAMVTSENSKKRQLVMPTAEHPNSKKRNPTERAQIG
jgi:hypothetical protein